MHALKVKGSVRLLLNYSLQNCSPNEQKLTWWLKSLSVIVSHQDWWYFQISKTGESISLTTVSGTITSAELMVLLYFQTWWYFLQNLRETVAVAFHNPPFGFTLEGHQRE
jgi:hypothetical protein